MKHKVKKFNKNKENEWGTEDVKNSRVRMFSMDRWENSRKLLNIKTLEEAYQEYQEDEETEQSTDSD